jgi:hypothetical protein
MHSVPILSLAQRGLGCHPAEREGRNFAGRFRPWSRVFLLRLGEPRRCRDLGNHNPRATTVFRSRVIRFDAARSPTRSFSAATPG